MYAEPRGRHGRHGSRMGIGRRDAGTLCWMPRATLPSGIELEYETFGSDRDPTLLLVMGLSAQLIHWDTAFCELLAGEGYRVVRFDNRDCGLSTHLDGQDAQPLAVMAAIAGGGNPPEVPYLLSDMAADAIGLLDHLGVDRAHIVGASMGGMIVQTMAIEHPESVASMVSVMSTPGDSSVGQPTPEAMAVLLRPPAADREAYIEAAAAVAVFRRRHFDLDRRTRSLRGECRSTVRFILRVARQLAAVWASGDRSEQLREVRAPDSRHPWSRRHAHHAQRGRTYRRADPRRQPSRARRHGPRPARTAVAVGRGRDREPHHHVGGRGRDGLTGVRDGRSTQGSPHHRVGRHRPRPVRSDAACGHGCRGDPDRPRPVGASAGARFPLVRRAVARSPQRRHRPQAPRWRERSARARRGRRRVDRGFRPGVTERLGPGHTKRSPAARLPRQ